MPLQLSRMALAAQGADVGIADIVDDDVLHEVAELVRAKGRRASVHIADMSSVEQIGRAVEAFVAEHGTVDIVVNSTTISGYVESPGFWDTTEEFYDKQMDVHLKASFFLCTQPTLPPPAHPLSHRGLGASASKVVSPSRFVQLSARPA